MGSDFETEIKSPSPSGYYSISPDSQKSLSAFIKKCRIDQKNIKSIEKAYNSCQNKYDSKLLWWQTPIGVISIGLTGIITGFVLGELVD